MSDRLDISNLDNSPRGTRFMLPDPGPEANGRECWDNDLCHAYEHYLERSNNRSVPIYSPIAALANTTATLVNISAFWSINRHWSINTQFHQR